MKRGNDQSALSSQQGAPHTCTHRETRAQTLIHCRSAHANMRTAQNELSKPADAEQERADSNAGECRYSTLAEVPRSENDRAHVLKLRTSFAPDGKILLAFERIVNKCKKSFYAISIVLIRDKSTSCVEAIG